MDGCVKVFPGLFGDFCGVENEGVCGGIPIALPESPRLFMLNNQNRLRVMVLPTSPSGDDFGLQSRLLLFVVCSCWYYCISIVWVLNAYPVRCTGFPAL